MLIRPTIFILLTLFLNGCASIDTLKTNLNTPTTSSAIIERSDYISSAIADWLSEEARNNNLQRISLSKPTNSEDLLTIAINQKLIASGLQIAEDEDNSDFYASYVVSEIDNKILIRIQANNREVSRLFTKGENNSIIPASPLTIRLNP